jgi:hypothetical protein
MKPFLILGALVLAAGGCTYGWVSDANSGSKIEGAYVSYRAPDFSGTNWGDVTLGGSVGVWSWRASDPGSNGGEGNFYLNPLGQATPGDTRPTMVMGGWQRTFVTKAGYDTRRFYRNHLYASTCNIPNNQGPYSAGSYPYNINGPYTSSVCLSEQFPLYPSTVNYVKDPDMIVDPRTLRDYEVAYAGACEEGATRCLRVSVGTANAGDGDLWLLGNSNTPGVTQRRFLRDGSTTDVALPNAVFLYHPQHNHIHLQNWTNLRLRAVQPNCREEVSAANCPVVGSPGKKISFCLTEGATFDSSYSPNPNRAKFCDWDSTTGAIQQGIGSGLEDVYSKGLPGQMIGIDGLPSGEYWLEVEVNPANENGQRTILESDYSNNITRIKVTF